MKVSIIIPIYNAIDVLYKTIGNILNQTYSNIEIILVDNNSTDNSLDYITKLQNKDKRVIAISEKKQGPNHARRAGLMKATGEYVMFCDSDDYIKEDAIQNFVDEINRSNADIVIGNYEEINQKREIIKKRKGIFFKDKYGNLKDQKQILFIKPALWNKIFRRDLIKEEFFIESTIGEDMVMTLESIMQADKITYIDKEVYEYVISDEGLSNSVSYKGILDILTTVEELRMISKKYKKYDEYSEEIEYVIFTHVIYKILRTVMMKAEEERKLVYLKLKDYLEKNDKYKKNIYYKRKLHYRIAHCILMSEHIYNLKITQFFLRQIFTNKILFTIFKNLDV